MTKGDIINGIIKQLKSNLWGNWTKCSSTLPKGVSSYRFWEDRWMCGKPSNFLGS